jgi:hypothetical protein
MEGTVGFDHLSHIIVVEGARLVEVFAGLVH